MPTVYQNQIAAFTVIVYGAGGAVLSATLSAATLTVNGGSPIDAAVSGQVVSATIPADATVGSSTLVWAWTQVAGGITSNQSITQTVTIADAPDASVTAAPSGSGMTRAQIKAAVVDIMGENGGLSGMDRPAMLDRWINTAADELARATDCYWLTIETDIIAGQSTYCGPELYKIKGVLYIDPATFEYRRLTETVASGMGYFSFGWRNAPAGTPHDYIVEGQNSCRLSPTPDTSSQVYLYADLSVPAGGASNLVTSAARPFIASDAGLALRVTGGDGFTVQTSQIESVAGGVATMQTFIAAPGSAGGFGSLTAGGLALEGYGVPGDSWPNATDSCPLPDRAGMGIVWRVCEFRAGQFPTPENQSRLAWFHSNYMEQRGFLEVEAQRYSDAVRYGDRRGRPLRGGLR